MSLETLIDENPIIQKIGVIEDPFKPPDTTTRYLISAQHLIRIYKGQETVDAMVDTIISNHLPSIIDRDRFLRYINNEHNMVQGLLYILFMEYAKEVLQIEDIYRFVGRNAINPMFLQIAAGESLGLNFIYEQVAKLTPNFTTAREVTYDADHSKKGFTVIRSRTTDDYRERVTETFGEDLSPIVLKNDCLLTQGVLEAGPKVVNPDNNFAAVVEEPYCELNGDGFCEHRLEWNTKPYLELSRTSIRSPIFLPNAIRYLLKGIGKATTTKIVNNLPSVKKYIDSILEMEVIIQQKTEEVEQRTAQLVQETNLGLLGRLSAQVAHELRTPQDATRNELELIKVYLPDLVFLHQDVEKLGLEEPIKTEFYELVRQAFEQAGKVEYRTRSTVEALARDLYEGLKAKYSNITLIACKDIVAMGYETDTSRLDIFLQVHNPGEVTGILRKVFNAGYAIHNALGSVTKEMSITNALLEHAHGDTKQIEPVDVREKLSTTLTLYDRVIKDSGIKLETYYDENLDDVECNAVRLNLAYRNVIQNAIDALKKKEGEGILRVKTESENGYAVIEISDNGPGIPPEDIDKLTHPTFTTKPIGEGTGLGLSIVHNILQEHNGYLQCSSQPGETIFRLKIPLKYQAKPYSQVI